LITISLSVCIGCGQCAEVCKNNAIEFDRYTAGINPEKCLQCGECVEVDCPGEAFKMEVEK